MAQVSLTNINGQTVHLDGDIAAITAIVTSLGFTAPEQSSTPTVDPIETKALRFIDFMSRELEGYIPGGKFFVSELNRLRLSGKGYAGLTGAYLQLINKRKEGWPQRRQLLLTASAIWRYTFNNWIASDRSSVRSDIIAATACSDCGRFATEMVNRMKAEGLWV